MQRLGVERIDLMQIHNLRDWQVQLETLQEWKAQGRIRYIGITTSHGRYHDELETICNSSRWISSSSVTTSAIAMRSSACCRSRMNAVLRR